MYFIWIKISWADLLLVSMEQDIAEQRAEKIRRRTEREKKSRLMKQANTGPAEDDEEMNERPNNTVRTLSLFQSEIFLTYMCQFTSRAVNLQL